MIRRRSLFVHAAVAVAALCSCGAGSAPSRPAPADENAAAPLPPPPAGVALVLSLPSLDHGVDGVLAFVDQVSATDGAELRAWWTRNQAETEGVDPARPVRIVVLATAREEKGWGLLLAATDASKLEDDFGAVRQLGSWAFIASPSTIDTLGPWALQTLARQTAPDVPVASVYPAPLLVAHAADVAAARARWTADTAPGMDVFAGEMFDAMIARIKEVDRVEVRLEANATRASVELAVFARSGTGLAHFITGQKPATFQLLPRLTTDGATVVAAGRTLPALMGGVYADLVERFIATMPKNSLTPTKEVVQRVTTMLAGEVAMSIARVEGVRLPEVDILLESATATGFSAFAEDGVRTGYVTMDPANHDGVRLASMGPEIRFGHWDDVTGFVIGGDARKRIERLVDVSRGRVAADVLPKKFAAAFDESRRRKESFLVVIDPVGFATRTPGEDGLALGLGFASGAMRIRATIDSRQAAAFLSVLDSAAF